MNGVYDVFVCFFLLLYEDIIGMIDMFHMFLSKDHLSSDMRFPTIRYVRPAKAQTSLHIRAV